MLSKKKVAYAIDKYIIYIKSYFVNISGIFLLTNWTLSYLKSDTICSREKKFLGCDAGDTWLVCYTAFFFKGGTIRHILNNKDSAKCVKLTWLERKASLIKRRQKK